MSITGLENKPADITPQDIICDLKKISTIAQTGIWIQKTIDLIYAFLGCFYPLKDEVTPFFFDSDRPPFSLWNKIHSFEYLHSKLRNHIIIILEEKLRELTGLNKSINEFIVTQKDKADLVEYKGGGSEQDAQSVDKLLKTVQQAINNSAYSDVASEMQLKTLKYSFEGWRDIYGIYFKINKECSARESKTLPEVNGSIVGMAHVQISEHFLKLLPQILNRGLHSNEKIAKLRDSLYAFLWCSSGRLLIYNCSKEDSLSFCSIDILKNIINFGALDPWLREHFLQISKYLYFNIYKKRYDSILELLAKIKIKKGCCWCSGSRIFEDTMKGLIRLQGNLKDETENLDKRINIIKKALDVQEDLDPQVLNNIKIMNKILHTMKNVIKILKKISNLDWEEKETLPQDHDNYLITSEGPEPAPPRKQNFF